MSSNEVSIILFNNAIAAAISEVSTMQERIAELEEQLNKKTVECDRLKEDNAEMLREIIGFKTRGFSPYGPIGF